MKKLQFSINIAAPREKVWNILWTKSTYEEWTAPFNQGGSSVQTDWTEGGRVLFTDSAGKEGMVSEIAALKPNEYMSFRHLGMLNNGVEDLESPEVKEWAGAKENYSLKDVNGQTELTVDMDITEEHMDTFKEAFPKALNIVKNLSEAN